MKRLLKRGMSIIPVLKSSSRSTLLRRNVTFLEDGAGNDSTIRKHFLNYLVNFDNGAYDISVIGSRKSADEFVELTMDTVEYVIAEVREQVKDSGESIELIGKRHNKSIEGIVRNINQTFDGEMLYPTVEKKAAHLLYSVIKGHPFIDGNKRIAVSLFIKL